MLKKKKIKDIVITEMTEKISFGRYLQLITVFLTFKEDYTGNKKEIKAWFTKEDAKKCFDELLICDNYIRKEINQIELSFEYIERQLKIYFEDDNEQYITLDDLNCIDYFVYIFEEGNYYWVEDIDEELIKVIDVQERFVNTTVKLS